MHYDRQRELTSASETSHEHTNKPRIAYGKSHLFASKYKERKFHKQATALDYLLVVLALLLLLFSSSFFGSCNVTLRSDTRG